MSAMFPPPLHYSTKISTITIRDYRSLSLFIMRTLPKTVVGYGVVYRLLEDGVFVKR